MQQYTLTWALGRHAAADAAPTEWAPASAPGAVQLDYARAHDWPPLAFGTNYHQYDGLGDSPWTYRARLDMPSLETGQPSGYYFYHKGHREYLPSLCG